MLTIEDDFKNFHQLTASQLALETWKIKNSNLGLLYYIFCEYFRHYEVLKKFKNEEQQRFYCSFILKRFDWNFLPNLFVQVSTTQEWRMSHNNFMVLYLQQPMASCRVTLQFSTNSNGRLKYSQRVLNRHHVVKMVIWKYIWIFKRN